MTVPVAVMMRRFQCPSCKRTFPKRAGAVGHMATCPSDPENRACKTCRHYNRREEHHDTSSCAVGISFTREATDDIFGHTPSKFTLHLHCDSWEALA